jgi:hypothetical protein
LGGGPALYFGLLTPRILWVRCLLCVCRHHPRAIAAATAM